MTRVIIPIIILLTSSIAIANDQPNIDQELKKRIDLLKMKPLNLKTMANKELFDLGKDLFFSKELSGNKNISCSTCHLPDAFTTDLLPLSLGEGAVGNANKREQNRTGQVIARNSPALYNLGLGVDTLFWDGRVSYDKFDEVYETPEKALNGYEPSASHITDVLTGALSAQALFPIVDHKEMRGKKGSNKIADAKNNLEAWSLVMERLLEIKSVKQGFELAFPDTRKFNIGHLGAAIAEFEKHEFASTNTPWDSYLRGDLNALDQRAKRGAKVFMGTGLCFVCHSGPQLSKFTFENIAAPQMGPGKDRNKNDEGRFLITGRKKHQYTFRTPPLRNVALTAPYLHSGVYTTLTQVVEHYEKGVNSIDDFDPNIVNDKFKYNYFKDLFVETNPYRIFRKKENAHPSLRSRSIRLSTEEKEDLIYFLKYGLTDKKFLKFVK